MFIVAPTGHDAQAMAGVLAAEKIQTQIFESLVECARAIQTETGALVFTEEALEAAQIPVLMDALHAQPEWSELPVIVLAGGGERRRNELLHLAAAAPGAVTVLERPMQAETLLSTVKVALRSRRRQYHVRDLVDEQRRRHRELEAAIGQIREAEELRARLAAIVESSDDAIISKTLDGIITSWNLGAERLFGYSAAEAVGQSIAMLIPAERLVEEEGILDLLRRGQRIEPFETVRVRKDGSRLDISLTISPLRDAQGRIIGASKVARDITSQKEAQQRLHEAVLAAESANRAKDRFLAVLSHELRTPLTPVVMTVAALEMTPDLPRSFRDDLKLIRRNIELESKLIDDLLDLSRITSGKLRLQFDALDINELIRQVCDTCGPAVREKRLHLHCDLPDRGEQVLGDPGRLQQVFWNLLNNAIKFTPEGGHIYLTTGRSSAPTVNGAPTQVRVTVRDTGIGISEQNLARIFDAFEQGDARMARGPGGLGLGLAISKALVEHHKGSIHVESEGPGRGTSFHVGLPLLASDVKWTTPADLRPAGADEATALRLLVVEDHGDTARVIGSLLSRSGHLVTTAQNASQALALIEEQPFDVIVSDLGLPDMSGYELMARIRERFDIKGIAMSGYGMEEDIRRSQRAGFSDHLVKPASLAQLQRAILRAARNTSAAESAPARAPVA